MFLPLLQLRWMGVASACNGELKEDREARIAASFLQSVPIRWYRKVKDKRIQTANNLVNDLFGVRFPSTSNTMYVEFAASLSLVDTPDGPAIEILCNDKNLEQYELVTQDDSKDGSDQQFDLSTSEGGIVHAIQSVLLGSTTPIIREIILLKSVDVVSNGNDFGNQLGMGTRRCRCDIKLYGLITNDLFDGTAKDTQLFGSGKKILQFDVHSRDNSENYAPLNDLKTKAEEVLHHLKAVVMWDRRNNNGYGVRYSEEKNRMACQHQMQLEFEEQSCISETQMGVCI